MIARFFLLWLFVTGLLFFWVWMVNVQEKVEAKRFFKRFAIAGIVAFVLLGGALIFNNISGV